MEPKEFMELVKRSNPAVDRQEWMTENIYNLACCEEIARRNTSMRRLTHGVQKALIVIKAQHPLMGDGTPGVEYQRRLTEALELGQRLQGGLQVVFATFGGTHEGHKKTLAEAGKEFLLHYGKFDEDQVKAFPEAYSGYDEEFLAVKEFEEDLTYAELHTVLSIGQVPRAYMNYIAMGWQPFFHPVTFLDKKPTHSMIFELWHRRGILSFADGIAAVQAVNEEIR